MKQYPSIPSKVVYDVPVYVYEKLDGSNIRAEWSQKKQGRGRGSFYKFGTRKRLLSPDDEVLGPARDLIKKQEEEISRLMIDHFKCGRGIFYFEFHGPNSFAGFHKSADAMEVTLLDIDLYKRGFVSQKDFQFIESKSAIPTPLVVSHECMTPEFEQEIRQGKFGSFEGVVCKGSAKRKKHEKPLMFKIKNQAWIDKVKRIHKENRALLKELL